MRSTSHCAHKEMMRGVCLCWLKEQPNAWLHLTVLLDRKFIDLNDSMCLVRVP